MPIHRALSLCWIAVATVLAAGLALAADDDNQSTSFITPFPKGEVYRVAVIGDDLADGLHYGLQETFQTDPRLQIAPKPFGLNGLMRPDHAEKKVALEEDLKVEAPNVAVVMLGAWDRVSLRTPSGKRIPVGAPQWRTEYGQRADRLIKALKRLNAAVYLVGLPNVRKYDANEDVQMMNDILRERAYLNGMKFVDSYAGFLDENGGFSGWGPDLSGKIVKLRDGDGIYFTLAGNRKLAHFVERELRRDIKTAQASRVVPLAGTEAEQSKINPGKALTKETASGTAADGSADGTNAAKSQTAGTAGDQPADNGRISLKTVNQSGREDVVTLDIVRPAIPASVVALVTRKESKDKPSQLGEVLIDRIAGGLNVMSTVTPPATPQARGVGGQLSPTQSAYYRVLVKGERIAPRPGRADDLVWPRPEAAEPAPAAKSSGGTTH